MRIQSKFRDYYDFISHRYGQDPQIVYERKPLTVTSVPASALDSEARAAIGIPDVRRRVVDADRWYCGASIVAGRYVFPFLRRCAARGDRWEMADEDNPAHRKALTEEWQDKLGKRRWWRRSDRGPLVPTRTPPEEPLYRVIRAVGVPVFAVTEMRWGELLLSERVPVLADHGIPALVSAEQMWQNLFHVLSNVLRTSPDKEPPCTVGNEDRIEAAGFDLRSSFRHPVNVKKVRP